MTDTDRSSLVEAEARRLCEEDGIDGARWESVRERAAAVVDRRLMMAEAVRAYGNPGERRKELNRRRG